MNKPIHLLLIQVILLAIANNTHAANLGGTIYVPNLHAKCLSTHQERLLECAIIDPTGEITPADLNCAEDSLITYRLCEAKLTKLRALDSAVPLIPKTYDTSKILQQLEKAEYGGYPE